MLTRMKGYLTSCARVPTLLGLIAAAGSPLAAAQEGSPNEIIHDAELYAAIAGRCPWGWGLAAS